MKLNNKKVVCWWRFKDNFALMEHIFYLKKVKKNEYKLMNKKSYRKDKKLLPKKVKTFFCGDKKQLEKLISKITKRVISPKTENEKYELKRN